MGAALITIRPMTTKDVAQVAEMESANQPRPWSEDTFLAEIEAENRCYLVAFEERLVGFAGAMVVGDESHVTNLLVTPDHRGRGVARRLMIALIEGSLKAGARHLTLEVRKENHAARSLYAGLGLAPVGVRPDYYGDDDALILWAHDIDQPSYLEGLR